MFLHGILHRIEGDYDNARAWYSNVSESDVFRHAWPGGEGKGGSQDAAKGFIAQVEECVRERGGEKEGLEKESLREIKAVVEFCRSKFGDEAMMDASKAFVANDEKIKQMSEDQITGGKGFRKF